MNYSKMTNKSLINKVWRIFWCDINYEILGVRTYKEY